MVNSATAALSNTDLLDSATTNANRDRRWRTASLKVDPNGGLGPTPTEDY